MNRFFKEKARLLELSPIAPANLDLAVIDTTGYHAAVFLDGEPFLLTGPADCQQSMSNARNLAKEPQLRKLLKATGYTDESEFAAGEIDGRQIDWKSLTTTLNQKLFDEVEVIIAEPAVDGALVAEFLALNTDIVRILVPGSPELDDGTRLGKLALAAMAEEFSDL